MRSAGPVLLVADKGDRPGRSRSYAQRGPSVGNKGWLCLRWQVAADAAGMRRLEAGLEGERLAAPEDPVARLVAAAFACAQTDSLVGDAVAEMVHLFSPPAEALGRPGVLERIEAFLAHDPDIGRPADVPTRAQFEDIVRGALG